MIYFARIGRGRTAPIKIGCSGNPSQRLKYLAGDYGKKVTPLVVIEGDRSVEREWHRRFSHLRIVGRYWRMTERFHPGTDLMEAIRVLKEARRMEGKG